MTLLEFSNVEVDHSITISFVLHEGEARVLQVPTRDAEIAVMDLALGELVPEKGAVFLFGQSIKSSKPGSIGWIPSEGGLINNLKTWENITLPLWYFNGKNSKNTEEFILNLLPTLGLDKLFWTRFMASPVAELEVWEKKLVCLLRGLVHSPRLLVVSAGLFDEVEASSSQLWISALDNFVHSEENRGLLVVAKNNVSLPWNII